MIVTSEINTVRQIRWQNPASTWGVVPTMGYLHDGHLSLVQQAKADNEYVAVTIYVNPTQFAPEEDLTNYPRKLDDDLALLKEAGVDLVFTPSNQLMYPSGFQTAVAVTEITQKLEGASRPTHFQGVTTVVSKLFNIIQPTRAYFGQKDAQQVATLQRMVTDLNFNLELIVCPIVREPDGLAMSSRNSYLSPTERQAGLILSQALSQAEQAINAGTKDATEIRQQMIALIQSESLAKLDYVSIANGHSLEELDKITFPCLISLAVFIGKTRLIDNIYKTDK